jgi:hypothetical protein
LVQRKLPTKRVRAGSPLDVMVRLTITTAGTPEDGTITLLLPVLLGAEPRHQHQHREPKQQYARNDTELFKLGRGMDVNVTETTTKNS